MAKQTNPTPAPERASTSDVTFNFVSREGGPERLVSEAEVVFPSTAGILAGLKLVGFSLWRSPFESVREAAVRGGPWARQKLRVSGDGCEGDSAGITGGLVR